MKLSDRFVTAEAAPTCKVARGVVVPIPTFPPAKMPAFLATILAIEPP